MKALRIILHRKVRIVKYIIYRETVVDHYEHLWSFLGAFIGIGLIAWIQSNYMSGMENIFLIGSFGASCVLLFGAHVSPLARPRNLIGGHVLSAFIGVTVYRFLPDVVWLSASLAVALSIVLMQVTKTLHPPGGATALIAVTGSSGIKDLGYWYILFPVFSGAMILLIITLLLNKLSPQRNYPEDSRLLRIFLQKSNRNAKKKI